jgi:hypothetical protein
MQNACNAEPNKNGKAVYLRFVLVYETWNCQQAANYSSYETYMRMFVSLMMVSRVSMLTKRGNALPAVRMYPGRSI